MILFFVLVLSAWLFIAAAAARFAIIENEWRSTKDCMIASPFLFLASVSEELTIFSRYVSEFLNSHLDEIVETPFLIAPSHWRHPGVPYDWLDPTKIFVHRVFTTHRVPSAGELAGHFHIKNQPDLRPAGVTQNQKFRT